MIWGVNPEERPKVPGNRLIFPTKYIETLKLAQLEFSDVEIFYESTILNKAHRDANQGLKIALSQEGNVVCYSIMGKFYDLLWKNGYVRLIHFYTLNNRTKSQGGRNDNSCSHGPTDAAFGLSGYNLNIHIMNYFVDKDGKLSSDGCFKPKLFNL